MRGFAPPSARPFPDSTAGPQTVVSWPSRPTESGARNKPLNSLREANLLDHPPEHAERGGPAWLLARGPAHARRLSRSLGLGQDSAAMGRSRGGIEKARAIQNQCMLSIRAVNRDAEFPGTGLVRGRRLAGVIREGVGPTSVWPTIRSETTAPQLRIGRYTAGATVAASAAIR